LRLNAESCNDPNHLRQPRSEDDRPTALNCIEEPISCPREFNLEPLAGSRIVGTMAKQDATHKLAWPWWSLWALLAVVVTSLLTIAATLNDIL
jgi:hypothetical protein